MKRLALSMALLGVSMAGSLPSAVEASLRNYDGQQTINGGRKMFKQNKRSQARRNK